MDVDFLISNTDKLNTISKDIISYNSVFGVKTRGQTEKATSSCRMWQMIMCILDLLTNNGYPVKELILGHSLKLSETDKHMKEYNKMITHISNIIDRIKENDVLRMLIYNNQYDPSIVERYDPDTMPMELGNNYMCIYIDGKQHSISHYFTVIQPEYGRFYLNSSYGSDYVCSNQYTTELTVGEFSDFIRALDNPGENEEYIGEFYNKFFLKTNVGVYVSKENWENEPALRGTKIGADEGNLREIGYITGNTERSMIHCGIIPKYQELIQDIVRSVIGGNRGHKTRKMRKSKSKMSSKSKVSSKSKTISKQKRRRSSRSSKRYSR